MDERDKNQGRARHERCHGQKGSKRHRELYRRCSYREKEATIRRLGELHRLLNSRKGSLNATCRKNTDANDKAHDLDQKSMQALNALAKEYVDFEASTRQEMYCMQQLWKWPKSSNEPRKIKAVYRTIGTARAMQ